MLESKRSDLRLSCDIAIVDCHQHGTESLEIMKSTKVQTLGAGHALAKHLVGSEDIRHYVEIRAY